MANNKRRGRPIGAKNKRPKYIKAKLSAIQKLFTENNSILIHPMYYPLLQEEDKEGVEFILNNKSIPISHQAPPPNANLTTSNKFSVIS